MVSLPALLLLAHLIGLALGVGSATVKVVLLFKCRTDHSFIPVFARITKLLTRQIILGFALMTLSGIGFLVMGYQITFKLGVKIGLVVVMWVVGPLIDNVFEPRFHKLTPGPGETASAEFLRAQKQHFAIEVVATLLFYITIIYWVI